MGHRISKPKLWRFSALLKTVHADAVTHLSNVHPYVRMSDCPGQAARRCGIVGLSNNIRYLIGPLRCAAGGRTGQIGGSATARPMARVSETNAASLPRFSTPGAKVEPARAACVTLKVSPPGGSYEAVKTNPRLYSAAQRPPWRCYVFTGPVRTVV